MSQACGKEVSPGLTAGGLGWLVGRRGPSAFPRQTVGRAAPHWETQTVWPWLLPVWQNGAARILGSDAAHLALLPAVLGTACS